MGARQALFTFGQRARAAGIRLESREQRAVRLHRERLTACFAGITAARLQQERLTTCFRGLVLRVHLRALGFVRAARAQRSDGLVHYVPCVTCRMHLAEGTFFQFMRLIVRLNPGAATCLACASAMRLVA